MPEEPYTSHLHLVIGGGGAAVLQRGFRLAELAELAMTAQSGLRHSHAPQQGGGGGGAAAATLAGLDCGRRPGGWWSGATAGRTR